LQSPLPGQAGVGVWAFTKKRFSNFEEEITSPAKNTAEQKTTATTFLIFNMYIQYNKTEKHQQEDNITVAKFTKTVKDYSLLD
jgi:hypothetical protein